LQELARLDPCDGDQDAGAELTAREDSTGYSDSWRAPAYAICAA